MSPTAKGVLSVLVPVVAWSLLGLTTRTVWGSNPRAGVLILIGGALLWLSGYLYGDFWGRWEERFDQRMKNVRALQSKLLGITNN